MPKKRSDPKPVALEELEKKLRYEEMMSRISEVLLRETEPMKALHEACRLLGETTGVSRVYIFENHANNTMCSNTVEWVAPGIEPVLTQLQAIPYESVKHWRDTLQKGDSIRTHDIQTLPPDVIQILEWQGILSILVAPLYLMNKWAGFLGFDECSRHRFWEDDDVRILLTASRLISAAIERRVLGQQLAHSGRLTAVGSLAAGVAHEYNNLHAAIMGLIELSLEDAGMGERARSDLQRVLGLVDRGVQMTQRLLDLSRRKTETLPVDMGRIVEDCLAILARGLKMESCEVIFSSTAERTTVMGNPAELSQIVLNLALNAVEAMEESPVKRIAVLLSNPTPDTIAMEVEDTGPGIPEHLLSAVFEPFLTTKLGQGEKGTKGTGLGLPIALRIAAQHGGTLIARNSAGGGALFRLTLPCL
jgi:signal transduction histidine kinase